MNYYEHTTTAERIEQAAINDAVRMQPLMNVTVCQATECFLLTPLSSADAMKIGKEKKINILWCRIAWYGIYTRSHCV